jgi:signal transduction protein with GAF and PtsI domain
VVQAATPRSKARARRTQPGEAARALRDVLQSHRTDMQAVFDMVATLTSTLSLDKLLAYVVKLCAELTGCVGALVYLWDEEGERLVVRAGVEGYEQWIGRFSLAMGEGLTGWTALTRQPGIIRDNPTADPRFKSVPELNDDRLQSYLTIPIVSPADRLLGVITLHTGAPHEFGEDDLTLMNTLSRLIAVAVENATGRCRCCTRSPRRAMPWSRRRRCGTCCTGSHPRREPSWGPIIARCSR